MGIGLNTLEDKTFLLLIISISLAFAWILWPFYGGPPAQGPGRPCSSAPSLRARLGDLRRARPWASSQGTKPPQFRSPAKGPRRLCRGAATLWARTSDLRKDARRRPSRHQYRALQSLSPFTSHRSSDRSALSWRDRSY